MADYPTSVVTFPTWVNGDDIDASNQNDPNDEITAIESALLNGFAHNLKAPGFKFDAAASKTIATGAITITSGYVTVDTEAAAATDDLDTVTIGVMASGPAIGEGSLLILKGASAARVVTVRSGAGNITLSNGNCVLAATTDRLVLLYSGSAWVEVARAGLSYVTFTINTGGNKNFELNAAGALMIGGVADGVAARGGLTLANTGGLVMPTWRTTASAANANVTDGSFLARSTSLRETKHDFAPITPEEAERVVLALRPTLYRSRVDADQRLWPGLIAEDVEAVTKDLVFYGPDGALQSVAYDRVPEYLAVFAQSQQARITALESMLTALAGGHDAPAK